MSIAKKGRFNVTYDIVSHESAEHGEAAESGLVGEGLTLREAVGLVGGQCLEADSYPFSLARPPRWFTNPEYGEDYATGDRESRLLHIAGRCSGHSAVRIARILGVKSR